MQKGIIVSIESTNNSRIKDQYNVQIYLLGGLRERTIVWLDVRDPNFIKIARRGNIIAFSEVFNISKNTFVHTSYIEIVDRGYHMKRVVR